MTNATSGAVYFLLRALDSGQNLYRTDAAITCTRYCGGIWPKVRTFDIVSGATPSSAQLSLL
jgi:hypothetical protein